VGIGVNTGSMLAGTVGGGGRLEYQVIGDAVNIAQRLQSLARASEILTSAATVAFVDGFNLDPVGPLSVKGRRAPVDAFRVLAG
jgi:class 3 adenylate cyclase